MPRSQLNVLVSNSEVMESREHVGKTVANKLNVLPKEKAVGLVGTKRYKCAVERGTYRISQLRRSLSTSAMLAVASR